MKDVNFVETCGIYNKDVETYFSIAAAEFMIILVLALAAIVSYLKKSKSQQAQSIPNINQASGAS